MSFNYGAAMYYGDTTRGVASPFFWDPHTQVWNNKPPVTIFTGSPGSGKTFFALTCAAISTICNKSTIVLDPKGDFINLLTIRDDLGDNINFLNMANGRPGIMDPFYISSNPSEVITSVIEVIDLFVGGLDDSSYTVLAPVVQDAMRLPVPSLGRVVDMLLQSDKPVARNLGTKLSVISKMKFANLCFAPGNRQRKVLSIEDGLTIITLVGLDLPKSAEEAKLGRYRLASGLLYLITNLIKRTLEESASLRPKLLIVDEAWAVASTEQGARVLQSCALLGRSKNLATILVTQNMSHLKNLNIETTVSTQFAFRSDINEGKLIASEMRLPEGEGYEEIVTHLENGECLVKDFLNRYSIVQISQWKKEWKDAFETNPMEKLRKAKSENN